MYIRNINNIDYIKVNDTATQIQLKIFDNLNNPFDLKSAMQVVVVVGNHNGRILTKIPDLLDDTGVLEFGLDNGDLLEVGHNLLEVHIIMPNGEKFVAPSKGYYKLSATRSIDTLGEEVTTVTLDYFLEEANRALDQMDTKVEYVNQTADDLRQEVGEDLNTLEGYVNQTANDLQQEVATAIQYVDDTVEDLRQEVSENLDLLVSQEVDNKMTPFAEDVNERLDKKANRDEVRKETTTNPIKLSELHTEVKEAMTGGSVPVVGENSVGTENIKQKAVTPKQTTFIDVSTNLFDKNRLLENTTIDTTTGEEIVSSGRSTTAYFIEVKTETSYSSKGLTQYAFYDENYNFIVSYGISANGATFTSPPNAKYLKMVTYTANLKDMPQLNEGSTLLPYQDYFVKMKDVSVGSELLEANSVTTEKYADKSITTEKYAEKSVTENIISDDILKRLPKTIDTYPAKPNKLDASRFMITDFLSGWYGSFSSGSIDEVNKFKGRNTFKITKAAGQGGIRAYSVGMTPINLVDYNYLEWWFYQDRHTEFTNTARIELHSGTGNNFRADIQRHLTPHSLRYGESYGWRRIRINLGDFYVENGTPDWSNITSINIVFALSLSAEVEFSLAQLDAVKLSKGVVSIDFDDALLSAYENGFPIMKNYGLKGTMYTITERIGVHENHMTWSQLHEMKNAGWTIGSHSHTHPYLGELTEEQVKQEFDTSQRILRENGFLTGSYFISAPYGSWSPICADLAKTRFIYTRSGRQNPIYSSFPLDDLYFARSHGTSDTTTFEDVKALVDQAILNKRWVPILFHEIIPDGGTLSNIGMYVSLFEQICSYIAQKRDEGLIEVMNVEEAVLHYKGIEVPKNDGHGLMSIGDYGEPITLNLKPNSQYI